MTSTKTTRTGFKAAEPELRDRYEDARRAKMNDAEAVKTSAKGLPRHMVEGWTRDICKQFDDLESVYAELRIFGPIKRIK